MKGLSLIHILDTLGDKKTALFLIMSDTDSTFNFLISMVYTQLFKVWNLPDVGTLVDQAPHMDCLLYTSRCV